MFDRFLKGFFIDLSLDFWFIFYHALAEFRADSALAHIPKYIKTHEFSLFFKVRPLRSPTIVSSNSSANSKQNEKPHAMRFGAIWGSIFHRFFIDF